LFANDLFRPQAGDGRADRVYSAPATGSAPENNTSTRLLTPARGGMSSSRTS